MKKIWQGFKFVAGPGIAPGLEDYEPSVLLYTTPRKLKIDFTILDSFLARG